MKEKPTTRQHIFGILFLIGLFAFGAVNLATEWHLLAGCLRDAETPESLADARRIVSDFENVVDDNVFGRYAFIEGYGYLQVLMNKKEIENFFYIKDKTGYLNFSTFYAEYRSDEAMRYAKRLLRLQEAVEDAGTKVAFINLPDKDLQQDGKYPVGSPNKKANRLQDDFILSLMELGVPVIDFDQYLQARDWGYEELFYRTDHHWTTQAAFDAYTHLLDEIKTQFGQDLDPDGFYRDLDNYNVVTYPQAMLGSMGRRSGVAFSGLDDFTMIYPKFETNFYWQALLNEKTSEREGSFESTLVMDGNFYQKNIYDQYFYSAYLNGVMSRNVIVNKLNPDGPKMLFISDSYSAPVAAFLSNVCGELHTIWSVSKEVNIESYLAENTFDYVFVMIYPGNYNDSGFSFFMKSGAQA